MKVKFHQWNCQIVFDTYKNGGTAISLVDEDGCPIATASVLLSNLKKDEIAIKDYSENTGMLEALLSAEIVTEPHRYVPSGFVMIPVCRLTNQGM